MCRSIAPLRGLEPPATSEEIHAAASQFIRKVAALSTARQLEDAAVRDAIDRVARVVDELITNLPARRSVPTSGPSSRRRSDLTTP
jgi:hypothetical protein